jgi:hypothetical protein
MMTSCIIRHNDFPLLLQVKCWFYTEKTYEAPHTIHNPVTVGKKCASKFTT